MRERECRSVLLGFSGGIDSMTAAERLLLQGRRVVALTLDTTGDEAMLEKARQRAQGLGIEHLVKDVRAEFATTIERYLIDAYLAGQTPAPCTLCNSAIKWRFLFSEAERLGLDAVATGHYFRVVERGGLCYVARAEDLRKDQSYYLWGLSQQVLRRVVTPMGDVIKSEIMASRPSPKESMGLCFLCGKSYREWLVERAPEALRRGDIVDLRGNVVGEHEGVAFYTIGQRKGLDVELQGSCVVAIDAEHNRLIVGGKQDLYHHTLEVGECNIVCQEELLSAKDVSVVVRGFGHNPQRPLRSVEPISGGYRVLLDDAAWAPAAGQPIVFYRDNRVLGGGILHRYY